MTHDSANCERDSTWSSVYTSRGFRRRVIPPPGSAACTLIAIGTRMCLREIFRSEAGCWHSPSPPPSPLSLTFGIMPRRSAYAVLWKLSLLVRVCARGERKIRSPLKLLPCGAGIYASVCSICFGGAFYRGRLHLRLGKIKCAGGGGLDEGANEWQGGSIGIHGAARVMLLYNVWFFCCFGGGTWGGVVLGEGSVLL